MTDPLTLALRSLGPSDRATADRYLIPAEVDVGCIVMEQGIEDPVLAYICSGALSILVDGRALYEIGPGEVAGAEDMFDPSRRTFTVVAAEPTALLLCASDAVGALRSALPQLGRQLEIAALRTLVRLTAELDQRIVEDARLLHRELDPSSTASLPLLQRLLDHPPVDDRAAGRGRGPLPPAIAALPERVRLSAAQLGRPVRFDAGAALLREGEPSNGVFVLAYGPVEALGTVEGEVYARLGTLGTDDVVGIGAAVLNRPHAATAVALGTVEALHLDSYAFNALLAHDSEGAGLFRGVMLRSMAAWLPNARDHASCAARCLRATLHERLFR